MNHAEYAVDLVNESGNVMGSKQRQEVNKLTDLYHTIFVILRTPDKQFLLSNIPDRKDLPNLYPGSIGATVATIRRHNETPDEAGIRALKSELFIDAAGLMHLGDTYLELDDGRKNYISVYRSLHSIPEGFNHKDIESLVSFNQEELNDTISFNKDRFAPTFLAIWQKYKEDLFFGL